MKNEKGGAECHFRDFFFCFGSGDDQKFQPVRIKTKMMSILKRIICAILIPFKMVFHRFCPRKVSTSPENQQRYQNIKESSHVRGVPTRFRWESLSENQSQTLRLFLVKNFTIFFSENFKSAQY